MINRYVLDGPVDIVGRSFVGFWAWVHLEPVDKPGWYWRINGKDVPITPALLRLGWHHMCLEYYETRMPICEHLLALQLAGMDGVRIVMMTGGLPYDGSGLGYWLAVQPYLRQEGQLEPCT